MHKNNEISFVKKKETTKKTQNINPTNNRREQLYAPISTSSSRIYFQVLLLVTLATLTAVILRMSTVRVKEKNKQKPTQVLHASDTIYRAKLTTQQILKEARSPLLRGNMEAN